MARRVRLWPWGLCLVLSLGVCGLILWSIWPSVSGPLRASFHPLPPPPPTPIPGLAEGERRAVHLFFLQEGSGALREQDRELVARATLGESVRDVVRALAAGAPGMRSPLPPGAEVRQVFLDDLGILYLDFTPAIQSIGSTAGPQAWDAVAALVSTITTNFSEVKRVRLLAEGRELAGVVEGVDLRRPILPRFPGEEGTSGAAPPSAPVSAVP